MVCLRQSDNIEWMAKVTNMYLLQRLHTHEPSYPPSVVSQGRHAHIIPTSSKTGCPCSILDHIETARVAIVYFARKCVFGWGRCRSESEHQDALVIERGIAVM
jgi:hypothetical protein